MIEEDSPELPMRDSALESFGHLLTRPWMIALAVGAVLAASGLALFRNTGAPPAIAQDRSQPISVSLLGVPDDAVIKLDGRAQPSRDQVVVSYDGRHVVSVHSESTGDWRQVFQTTGPLTLIVDCKRPVVVKTRVFKHLAQPETAETPVPQSQTPPTEPGSNAPFLDPWRTDNTDRAATPPKDSQVLDVDL